MQRASSQWTVTAVLILSILCCAVGAAVLMLDAPRFAASALCGFLSTAGLIASDYLGKRPR